MSERSHWILLGAFGYIVTFGSFIIVGVLSNNWLLIALGFGLYIGLSLMTEASVEIAKIDLRKSETQMPLKDKDANDGGAR